MFPIPQAQHFSISAFQLFPAAPHSRFKVQRFKVPHKRKAEKLVRSEKTCVGEGESPSSLEARLPEFGTKVMNGKV